MSLPCALRGRNETRGYISDSNNQAFVQEDVAIDNFSPIPRASPYFRVPQQCRGRSGDHRSLPLFKRDDVA